jgi:hypothetical protein
MHCMYTMWLVQHMREKALFFLIDNNGPVLLGFTFFFVVIKLQLLFNLVKITILLSRSFVCSFLFHLSPYFPERNVIPSFSDVLQAGEENKQLLYYTVKFELWSFNRSWKAPGQCFDKDPDASAPFTLELHLLNSEAPFTTFFSERKSINIVVLYCKSVILWWPVESSGSVSFAYRTPWLVLAKNS